LGEREGYWKQDDLKNGNIQEMKGEGRKERQSEVEIKAKKRRRKHRNKAPSSYSPIWYDG